MNISGTEQSNNYNWSEDAPWTDQIGLMRLFKVYTIQNMHLPDCFNLHMDRDLVQPQEDDDPLLTVSSDYRIVATSTGVRANSTV
jgi:hypothetical protein